MSQDEFKFTWILLYFIKIQNSKKKEIVKTSLNFKERHRRKFVLLIVYIKGWVFTKFFCKFANFATVTADVVDTGDKFANDTGGAPFAANISANFRKKLKRLYWCSGAWGKLNSWNNLMSKSRGTVPLKYNFCPLMPVSGGNFFFFGIFSTGGIVLHWKWDRYC